MTNNYKQILTDKQKQIYDEGISKDPNCFIKDDMINLVDIYSIVTCKDKISDFTAVIWYLNYPINIDMCRNIVSESRYMDKKNIESMFFSGIVLDIDVEEFLNVIVDIGNSLGVSQVAKNIYERALDGDEKYSRMYLDMFKDKMVSDSNSNENIMRVSVALEGDRDDL